MPVTAILPILQEYLDSQDETRDIGPVTALAERMGNTTEDWLLRILKGKVKTVDFDFADTLLCAVGRFYLWYSDPLRDIYESVVLAEVCERPGCGRKFISEGPGAGGLCPSCVKRAEIMERVPAVCAWGHPMTDENVIINATTHYYECRECRNSNARARRRKRAVKGSAAMAA